VSPQRKALVVIVIAAILGISLVNALALTPKEREKAKKVLEAVEMAGEHIKALQSAAEAANLSAQVANDSAGSAWSSAFQVGLTAKKAQEEAERCQKENARMRPIVDAVTGPWWFPGGKALIYGAKKSLLSLVVILVGGFVLFLIIKIVLTVVTGGTWSAGLGAVTGIFGKLGRWFGRAGKRLLSFFTRRGKTAADNIRHRTIGTDDD
jgi:type II secretory pathway pseudopilin PulG